MKRRLMAAAAAAIALAGCATIVRGSEQTITISSNVEGADILLDGAKIGTTPFAGVVRKGGAALTVSKDGYRTATVALSTTLEPWFWGNIIIGGTLGSITDFATDSAFQYAPAAYQVDLKPAGQAQSDFERRVATRKFAMLYLDRIAADLGRGDGEHLATLLAIVNGGRAAPAGAQDVRRALRTSEGDPVAFGRLMVELI